MNKSDWESLLIDVLENDSDYKRSLRSAWMRIEAKPMRRVWSASAWLWMGVAACLGGLVAGLLWKTKEPLPLRLPVEIVSTRDLPRSYSEIDDQALLQLFPHGIIVAYGAAPQVYAFTTESTTSPVPQ